MSSDPHAPTPAGPDPDEATEVHATPSDPFLPPVEGSTAADETPTVTDGVSATTPDAPVEATASLDEPYTGDAATDPGAASIDPPPSAGALSPDDDWLKPDAGTSAATPEPDPAVRTPSAFTPLGTPEAGPLDQAKALTDRPEVMVGLAFAGGVVVSFILKRFGR